MTMTTTTRWTAAEVDARAHELVVEAEQRIDELDALGHLPTDLATEAAAAGLFRQLIPADLGGWDGTPIDWFQRGVRLAAVEAGFAWVVTQGSAELGWIGAGGDREWATHVLADPMASSASTVAGLGQLHVDGDTATLKGRWSFDTGCHGATWIGGLALVDPTPTDGSPPFRMCWVPAGRATIIDDWDPTGLRGTGSAGVEIAEQSVPLTWTVAISSPAPDDRGRHSVLVGNGNWPIACSVAATLLGIARRALDEATSVVGTKMLAPFVRPLSTDSAVLRSITKLEGRWAAAVALVEAELQAMWDEADARSLSVDTRVRLATACVHARDAALDVVDGACELAGSAAVPARSPLSRCMRDAHTLRGHISTGPTVLETAAQARLGLSEPGPLV
jgi:alkylation response protein AidB-like acyl-CoA dehydrogenase